MLADQKRKIALPTCAFLAFMAFVALLRPITEANIIIDHSAVELFNQIPDYWLNEVKKMLLNVPGESHSIAYREGLVLLASMPGCEKYTVNISSIPESPTDTHLRISAYHRNENNDGWIGWSGEEHFWTTQDAIDMMKQHLAYMNDLVNPVHAFGIGWCWDMTDPFHYSDPDSEFSNVRWYGRTFDLDGVNYGAFGLDAGDSILTNNALNMQDYLNAVDSYNNYAQTNGIKTITFFTTGPVDDNDHNTGERGYQRYLKHEFIRDYVRNSQDKVLFDYADILTHNETGIQNLVSWEGNNFPYIHPDNAETGDPNDTGHIGANGAIRIGKALWVLMAKIAGWDGCAAVQGDVTGDCAVTILDFVAMADSWLAEAGTLGWDKLCDIAPDGGDGIINVSDFAALSSAWLASSCEIKFESDFDRNCRVDVNDLAIFADAWLSGPGLPGWDRLCDIQPAEGDELVDIQDFAILSDQWLRDSR